jgi:hypothetical protein
MVKDRLLQRVDELIEMGYAVVRTRHATGNYDEDVHAGPMTAFRSVSLSFIRQVYGEQHPHYREFSEHTDCLGVVNATIGVELLRAIRGEVAGDWLFTVKGLVTAEVFTDYMEMAEYLLQEQFKDAAAVIAGSTLEEHLRQLCRKNGIPVVRQKDGKDVPLKADQLNSELTKTAVYTTLDQKQVTAWLDLRNKAAHGEYKEYNADQVKGMITGITEFIGRVAV